MSVRLGNKVIAGNYKSQVISSATTEQEGIVKLATENDITDLNTTKAVTPKLLKDNLNTKQDVISDLDTIRDGASKGSTALQSVPDEYVTETELNNKGYLTSYTETDPMYTADKPNLALKSELPDLAPYATKEELNSGLAGKQEAGDYALKSEIPTNNNQLENGAGYVTADYHDSTKQDVISDLDEIRSGASKGSTALQSVPSEYVTETELNNKVYLTEHQDISNLVTKDELTTGLSDKQDVISDLETIREGASKGSTALQSIPSEYVTETELESKGYLTEHQDISNLATKEEINSKQDKLVSGTTIKTINGESLLGSGNIEVKAGTQYAMVVVDHTV